ncbi:phosphoribosyl-AMP cyclohydrolase [Isoalcanivorax indicus]|uniref:phosphoribosyl-AMP cyclohydrolase n=1 Tax=Isoalcanivorax indicus TaxID=2202653 RepID=UPI000DB92D03|nr:phosphoribosyl-AMP cyclohydrolase [Isoalcanivorax indicus]
MFKDNEQQAPGFTLPLTEALDHLAWNADGLVPAVAQQHDTGEILMVAWMNRAALQETLDTGRVCYYSRSRQTLWRKGESSGQTQKLVELRIDCDGDVVLVKVEQTGPACHTGRRDCFFWRADGDTLVLDKAPLVDPATLYPNKTR